MVANIWPMNPSGVQLSRPILAPGPAHPQQLVGGDLVVRREHHADAGDDRVEGRVVEGQRLGVGLLQVIAQVARRCARPDVEQRRREVAGDHLGPGSGGRERGVAAAGRDVEDAVPGRDAAWPRRGRGRSRRSGRWRRWGSRRAPTCRGAWPSARHRRSLRPSGLGRALVLVVMLSSVGSGRWCNQSPPVGGRSDPVPDLYRRRY